MSRKALFSLLLLTVIALGATAAKAQDPSLHEVYQAVEAGKLTDAQRMMDKVLHDHPNSAKAHYVEAELLAKEGRYANTEVELSTAERLEPGLPFASATAVRELKDLIRARNVTARPAMESATAPAGTGLPWTAILVGLGILALGFVAFRLMKRPAVVPSAPGFPGGSGFGGNMGPQPPYSPMGGAPATMAGGGIGSGILGGLATGAAVGAGVVAGEALMNRLTEGHREAPMVSNPQEFAPGPAEDILGGNDFGVSGGSSWDDAGGAGGGGGDSDWS